MANAGDSITFLYMGERRQAAAPVRGAYLAQRYRAEFGMGDIPQPVQRVVFPIVVAIGRLFGVHRRFADAPEQVQRN